MTSCPVMTALWLSALASRQLSPELVAEALRLLDAWRGSRVAPAILGQHVDPAVKFHSIKLSVGSATRPGEQLEHAACGSVAVALECSPDAPARHANRLILMTGAAIAPLCIL